MARFDNLIVPGKKTKKKNQRNHGKHPQSPIRPLPQYKRLYPKIVYTMMNFFHIRH